MSTTDLSWLGTTVVVWAHPDDETYLSGGTAAALVDLGHRVVAVTATRGDAGGPDPTPAGRAATARLRTAELEEALRVLGVTEHHWLGYEDGRCADADPEPAVRRLADLFDDVRPDTVVTFGPDGFTGHPDHRAVSRWVDLALARSTARRPGCCTPSPPSRTASTRSSTTTSASSSWASRASSSRTSSPCGWSWTRPPAPQGGRPAGAGVPDRRPDRGRRPGPVLRLGRGRGRSPSPRAPRSAAAH